MKNFVTFCIIIAVAGLLYWYGEIRTAALDRNYECVTEKAKADGYPAPYSREAWDLYTPLCQE